MLLLQVFLLIKSNHHGSHVVHLRPRVHRFILIMQQLVLFLLFLQLHQLLLKHLFQRVDQFLVVGLDLADLYFRPLQHFVLDLVAVALHRDAQPRLQAGLEGAQLTPLLGAVLHAAQVLAALGVGFPGREESAFVVAGVEKGSEVLDLVAFLLHLPRPITTLRLRMQYASNSFRLCPYSSSYSCSYRSTNCDDLISYSFFSTSPVNLTNSFPTGRVGWTCRPTHLAVVPTPLGSILSRWCAELWCGLGWWPLRRARLELTF